MTAAPKGGHASPRNVAAMLLLAVMWGLSIPATKLGVMALPPLTLTALRFAIAVPLLFLLVAGTRFPSRDSLPSLTALGVLGVGIGQVAQTYGVEGTSASVSTIISATIPVFIVIFASIRLRQAISSLQKAGLMVAFTGIALVAIGSEGTAEGSSSLAGVGWALLSSVAIGFYYVWSVQLAARIGSATMAAWSTFFGFISLLPLATWELMTVPVEITGLAVGMAAYLGAVVTVGGMFLWIWLAQRVAAGIVASVQYLQPLIGIAVSAALFGDHLGLTFGMGVAMVLAGLGLSLKARTPAETN